jgi:hypothetical protein
MPQVPTPWVGLATLIVMFAIPFLPDRLFEGPGRSSTGHAATSAASAVGRGPSPFEGSMRRNEEWPGTCAR